MTAPGKAGNTRNRSLLKPGRWLLAGAMLVLQSGCEYPQQPKGFMPWMPEPVSYEDWRPAQAQRLSASSRNSLWKDPETGFNINALGGQVAASHKVGSSDRMTLTHFQHFYSRTNPANITETHALGSAGRGASGAALWDLQSMKFWGWVPTANPESHHFQRQLLWDRTSPNVYWFTQGNQLQQASIDFTTGKVAVLTYETFEEFAWISFGHGEGNFSDNGQRLVLSGKLRNHKGFFIQPYDVKNKKKYPPQLLAGVSHAIDWVSADPSGRYIVYATTRPQSIQAMAFEHGPGGKVTELLDDIKHGDFVLDNQGEPWFSYGNWQGLFATRVRDGKRKRIWPTGVESRRNIDCKAVACESASGHVSRVSQWPGLVLMSRNQDGGFYFININSPGFSAYAGNSYHGKAPPQASTELVKTLGVDPFGEVTNYYREPRGAVSPSGRFIFFTSDFQYYRERGGYEPEPENRALLHVISVSAERQSE